MKYNNLAANLTNMRKIYLLLIAMFFVCFVGNVHAQAPTCTANVSPVNNSTNLDPYPSITLTWTAVAGATSYDVYVSAKTPPKQMVANVTTNSFKVPDLFYSTLYYWYVVPRNADGAAIGCTSSITTFTTSPTPPPPANDECNGALDISTVPISGTTLGATESLPAIACDDYTGNANDDVWYSYTAPTNGDITISLSNNSSFDGVMEIFSGACGGASLTCSDSSQMGGKEQILLKGVIAGTTYKIRVYGFYGTLSSRGGFSIATIINTPLPISLVNFSGEKKNNKNILKWSTAMEQNNVGFELQYSADGINFDKLAFVNSKAVNGNSSSGLAYEFSDAGNFNSNAYYRLKQIDKNGKSFISNVVFLKGNKTNKIALGNIFPNPAHNTLNITIAAPVNDKIKVEIRDIAGKLVLRQPSTVVDGNNKLPLNVASLPGGSYFIKAISSNGEQSPVSKFVKQ
jgi:hypothetical protein